MSELVAGTHGPPCTAGADGGPCVRCAGFKPGHELSVGHGAYSTLRLGDRAKELADELRAAVPSYRPGDEPALQLLGLSLARVEVAEKTLEGADPDDFKTLRADQRGWGNLARRLMHDLGMVTLARARLGLDVARTRREMTLTSLVAEAEQQRRGDLDSGDVVDGEVSDESEAA